MALIFKREDYEKGVYANRLKTHRDTLAAARLACHKDTEQLATNAGITPADTYRAFDSTTKIEPVPAGHLALLTRAFQVARPVNVGKQVFEYRQSSRAGNAGSSMSGRTNIVIDHTEYGYEGTVVPVHDDAFGRPWREQSANAAEMFDALVDDARESERTLMELIDNYMWDGSTKLTLKGRAWLGLRNDPSVATAVLGVDLTSNAVTGEAKRDEVKRVRDILRIDNDCSNPLTLVVSREIKSSFEDVLDTTNGSNITVEEYIMKLSGLKEIVEDAALTGNQIAMVYLDQSGFHPVVGMDVSTYPVPRAHVFDDYNFVKWAAVGFVAKQSKEGKKCALYAE